MSIKREAMKNMKAIIENPDPSLPSEIELTANMIMVAIVITFLCCFHHLHPSPNASLIENVFILLIVRILCIKAKAHEPEGRAPCNPSRDCGLRDIKSEVYLERDTPISFLEHLRMPWNRHSQSHPTFTRPSIGPST